jgi:hypothetical protein
MPGEYMRHDDKIQGCNMTDIDQVVKVAKIVEQRDEAWLSTYSRVTAERILGYFDIKLTSTTLTQALLNPKSVINIILKTPFQQVVNGVIMQQAHDYQVYVQKLFVDYLLSGEQGKPEDSPGGMTRKLLDESRQAIEAYGKAFHEEENRHYKTIAETQQFYIHEIKAWDEQFKIQFNQLKQNLPIQSEKAFNEDVLQRWINHLDVRINIEEQPAFWTFVQEDCVLTDSIRVEIGRACSVLINKIMEIDSKAQQLQNKTLEGYALFQDYRQGFRKHILQVIEYFHNLPEYDVNPAVDEVNKELLHFNINIGDRPFANESHQPIEE